MKTQVYISFFIFNLQLIAGWIFKRDFEEFRALETYVPLFFRFSLT